MPRLGSVCAHVCGCVSLALEPVLSCFSWVTDSMTIHAEELSACHSDTTFQPYVYINPSMFYFREDAGEPDSWSTLSHVVHSGDCCVKYHQGLSVYTLTAEAKNGAKAALEDDIERLQKCIKTHQHAVRKGSWQLWNCNGPFLPHRQCSHVRYNRLR